MSDRNRPEALHEPPEVQLTLFDVLPDTNEIAVADYEPDFDRYTMYDACPDDLRFGESFDGLLERCEALGDMIYQFAVEEADGDHAAFNDWDASLANDIVQSLSGEQSAKLTKQLQSWFEKEPDSEELDSAANVIPVNGQQFAFELFWDFDPEILDALQIEVIEGPQPGSNARGAVMLGTVDEANRIAEERGIPWRFRHGG